MRKQRLVKWQGDTSKTAVLYYQGKDCSQVHAIKYLGGQDLITTTDEKIGYNQNGIYTIDRKNLWIYPEIEEINKKARFGFLGRLKHWWRGIFVSNDIKADYSPLYDCDEKGSVYSYSVDKSLCSLGQSTDIAAHQKRYDALTKKYPDKDIIGYGVSRGAATTFAAIADQSQKMKLCVLEAPPGSIRNLVKNQVPFLGLGQWFYHSRFAQWILGKQHRPDKELQAHSYADRFPHDLPLVIISSKKDTVVPHDNSLKLAQIVAHNRLQAQKSNQTAIAPVYFIQLDDVDHNDYSLLDSSSHDAERYQNTLHAVYQKHQLPFIAEFAKKGEFELDEIDLTQGVLAKQVEFQGEYKANKVNRPQIHAKALDALKTIPRTERQTSICAEMRMYAKSQSAFFRAKSTRINPMTSSNSYDGIACP